MTWASVINRIGKDLERPLAGVVAEIYDVLTADEAYEEEARE